MELTSMAIPKDVRAMDAEMANVPDLAPEYPYGLRINLDKAQIGQLGLTGLPIKTEMYMKAEVCIIGLNDDEQGMRMELQIKEMAFEVEAEEKKEEGGVSEEKKRSIMSHYGG